MAELAEKQSFSFSGPVVMLLALAVLGRFALMGVPSVEPIIPIAILVAISHGIDNGVIVGALGYPLSNFLSGYFGEWNLIQMAAGGLAVAAVYFKPKKLNSSLDLIWLTVIGTLLFEVVVNSFGGDLDYWLASMPFTGTHVISNIIFATVLSGFVKQKSELKK